MRNAPIEQLWYCPACEQPFKTVGVSGLLTVRCPHCDRLQNIIELHKAGSKLILAGILTWQRMFLTTEEYEFDEDKSITEYVIRFQNTLNHLRNFFRQLQVDSYIDELAASRSKIVRNEREQNNYFKKNPGTSLRKGEVVPYQKNASKKSSKRSKTSRSYEI